MCYDKDTKIVYIKNQGCYCQDYTRTMYLSSSGKPYKYNTATKKIEEVSTEALNVQ